MKQMKFSKKKIVLIFAVVLILVFGYLQNNVLTVSKYVYQNENLPDSFADFRILQISDYHNKGGLFWEQNFWEVVVSLEPDMIVLTGDLLDSGKKDAEQAARIASECQVIAPTYFITGNHEFWVDEELLAQLLQELEDAGVTVLDNRAFYLAAEESHEAGGIALLGLSDRDLNNETLRELTEEIAAEHGKEEYIQILLAHEPQYINRYAACSVDLVLAGHAHGGQIRLPGVGGIYAPDQGFWPEYTEGMHRVNDTTMIVSRGIGNSVFPLRLFNYPELVLVTLQQ